jgi:hypothetical protein
MGLLQFMAISTSLVCCCCTNFEDLRKDQFVPEHATKVSTTFLPSNAVDGKFLKFPLKEGHPLMLLKRGLGYSVVQLHGGSIGEVPTEVIREKNEGETFVYSVKEDKPVLGLGKDPAINLGDIGNTSGRSAEGKERYKIPDYIEIYPILNNSLESVEPALPEW